MMPVLFLVGNYLIIGTRYFRQWSTFLTGTAIVAVLYWVAIITITLAIRGIITRLPEMRQTAQRISLLLGAVLFISLGLGLVYVWIYSLIPATGVVFSWETVQAIWLLGLVSTALLSLAIGLFYSLEQWKQNKTETEQLQQLVLQQQLDALKGQVNPHFLFNSLSAISALISEDPAGAERYVDKLSQVYRYMLQAANRELVTVAEELAFTRQYADLLRVRYGPQLQCVWQTDESCLQNQLPPLSLQTLVDNALKHNAMSAECPLVITLRPTPFGQLQVINNRQPRKRIMDTQPGNLSNLLAKYRLLTDRPVLVEQTDTTFSVTVPLIAALA